MSDLSKLELIKANAEVARINVDLLTRIRELEGCLRRSPCPRPWPDEDGTVADCIAKNHCGCENLMALIWPKGFTPSGEVKHE